MTPCWFVKVFFARIIKKVLSVVHDYYYLLALLIIHSFRTSICVCKYLYLLSVTFDDRRGVGLMTLTFLLTSAGPGPTSVALKFYIFSAEIAIPLRLMLIPLFHPGSHISMISNSVTHLQSYTNSAIADIAGNSAPIPPVTPQDRRRLRTERRVSASSADIVASDDLGTIADVAAPNAEVFTWRADIVASNEDCSSVSQCFIECFMMFHLWFTMFYDVSQCFTCVSWCFTMFNNALLCLVSRSCRSPQGSRQRRRDRQ